VKHKDFPLECGEILSKNLTTDENGEVKLGNLSGLKRVQLEAKSAN